MSLRRPPPLERPLGVRRENAGALSLLDGDELVAEARRAAVAVDPPPPVAADSAEQAAAGFPYAHGHPFPTCFVCGPEREAGDGLRIFPGQVEDRELYAALWEPEPALAGSEDALPPELVWAALDCPTSVPVANAPRAPGFLPIVLARLAARIVAPVRGGQPHVVTAAPIEIDGRKRHAAAAIWSEDGELCAFSRALWIELRG